MPTTKPRYPVTETPEVAAALAAAARRWPEDQGRPARLLRRLIEEGHRSIEPEAAELESSRRAALRRVSGAYTGLYDQDYLQKLRAEWPE
ncbi:hypothetical protein FOE78_08515 [Microlunatus elymi]|uniref:Uncharacterized protein n=1 Tax=Microlunatus elymi TaxID=2596828 RepID=A0A516PXP5_9ACTN|nr:hypothetical protein [Microlunatus elymi]QDP95936.1 hypothetical protein FOE78_08515 [Microlunatus elymi]